MRIIHKIALLALMLNVVLGGLAYSKDSRKVEKIESDRIARFFKYQSSKIHFFKVAVDELTGHRFFCIGSEHPQNDTIAFLNSRPLDIQEISIANTVSLETLKDHQKSGYQIGGEILLIHIVAIALEPTKIAGFAVAGLASAVELSHLISTQIEISHVQELQELLDHVVQNSDNHVAEKLSSSSMKSLKRAMKHSTTLEQEVYRCENQFSGTQLQISSPEAQLHP